VFEANPRPSEEMVRNVVLDYGEVAISNLRRHPQATLVAIDEHAATYAS
jgi:hypothetical protein